MCPSEVQAPPRFVCECARLSAGVRTASGARAEPAERKPLEASTGHPLALRFSRNAEAEAEEVLDKTSGAPVAGADAPPCSCCTHTLQGAAAPGPQTARDRKRERKEDIDRYASTAVPQQSVSIASVAGRRKRCGSVQP
eukprot:6927318-Prymnesium_polylepis.3